MKKVLLVFRIEEERKQRLGANGFRFSVSLITIHAHPPSSFLETQSFQFHPTLCHSSVIFGVVSFQVGFNIGFCIYYVLSLPTELNLRGQRVEKVQHKDFPRGQ